jgi:hypothetical protein
MDRKMTHKIAVVVIGGFILALLVAECRQVRQTHDDVIKIKESLKIKK